VAVRGTDGSQTTAVPHRRDRARLYRARVAPRITPLGDRLYLIDAMMWNTPERLACYFYDTAEPLLIECGPSATMSHLVEALDDLGIDDVARIAVTHIHLDHAGAAGHLAARYPNARVSVHEHGARHMTDPTRLLASAERIYGADGMESLWGRMDPVAADRIETLDEGSTIPLGGGAHIEVMYTPGHARHHVVFHDADRGAMYVGDAAGMSFPHGHFVQPATPPPDLDPPVLAEQLRRMARRRPRFLGFAHFGVRHDSERALDEAASRLDEWVSLIASLGAEDDESAGRTLRRWTLDRYRREGAPQSVIDAFDSSAFWAMQVTGVRRWLRTAAG